VQSLCNDLEQESAGLSALIWRLTERGWSTPTPFYGWTIWDEIAHLCFFEEAALLALTDAPAFERHAREIAGRLEAGTLVSALARERYGQLPGDELCEAWTGRASEVGRVLSRLSPKARLPWYGPPMSARSFATARLMETWAHGQDIHDALGARREKTPRTKHVAHLGVTTFGWSFSVRGLAVPARMPYVELRGAGGETWAWGDPDTTDRVQGDAQDLCLVVTQRRNVADTGLECRGDTARTWMAIAQCFAGPPSSGPAPGAFRARERPAP
jgi:uncharacterized protein (TIGR03084 family)